MRVPADKPSKAVRLRHQPLFAPLVLPMLGFFTALAAVIWLALAYQQTTTIVLAVWDQQSLSDQGALFRLAGRLDVDAAYAIGQSPFGDVTFVLPGDPIPARPLESIPAIVNNSDNGSVLLWVNRQDLAAVMTVLELEQTAAAGELLMITVPTLGRESVLRIRSVGGVERSDLK